MHRNVIFLFQGRPTKRWQLQESHMTTNNNNIIILVNNSNITVNMSGDNNKSTISGILSTDLTTWIGGEKQGN